MHCPLSHPSVEYSIHFPRQRVYETKWVYFSSSYYHKKNEDDARKMLKNVQMGCIHDKKKKSKMERVGA